MWAYRYVSSLTIVARRRLRYYQAALV